MRDYDLKFLRFNKGRMTQEELSRISGVNRITISKIENGATPSVKIAKKLSNALGVDWRLFYD